MMNIIDQKWKVGERYDYVVSINKYIICQSITCREDANLIAAAPELLKFAQFIAKHEKGCAPSAGYFQEMIEKAEKAINKALGK